MAEIDKLLSNLAQKGIQYACLTNGQPTRLFKDGQEGQSGTLNMLQLLQLTREVVPLADRAHLTDKYDKTFPYTIPEGFFNLRIQRKKETLQVEIWLRAVSAGQMLAPPLGWLPTLLPASKGVLHQVRDVALSGDGTRLASACAGSFDLWDSATGKRISTLWTDKDVGAAAPAISLGLRFEGWCVEFAPNDGKILGGMTHGFWTWPSAGNGIFSRLSSNSVRALAFSPDGADFLLGTSGETGLTDTAKTTMQAVAVASTVARIAFGTPDIDSLEDKDGLLQLFNNSVGKFHVWNRSEKPPSAESEGIINSVAVSPDGRYLLSGDNWHMARIYDLRTLEMTKPSFFSLRSGVVEKARKHRPTHSFQMPQEVLSVSCGAVGTHAVASCREQLMLFDVTNGHVVWRQRGKFGKSLLSRHGDLVFVASGPALLVLSAKDGSQSAPPLQSPSTISALATSRDGRTLACGCGDGSLHAWRLW